MQQEKSEKEKCATKGYLIIPCYYPREAIKKLGAGPAIFYQYLLTYCHKDEHLAWPSLSKISRDTGFTRKTVTRYYRKLYQYGLIKNISKRKATTGGYMRNVYQLTPLTRGKNILQQGNNSPNLGVNFTHTLGEKLRTNINHMNINHTTTKDAVVDFKKTKDKGEEKMKIIREKMLEFDFTESFTEKVLKKYPLEKVEEKLELYAEGREVRNPAGWFIAALREGYGEEKVKDKDDMSPPRFRVDTRLRREDTSCSMGLPRRFSPRNDRCKSQNENEKTLSRKEAIKQIQGIRKNLMAMNG